MRRVLLGLVVLLAVVAASCGDYVSDRIAAAPVSLPGRVENEGTLDATATDHVTIELRDFAYKPTFIRGAPGRELSIALDNTSSHAHTFTVSNLPGGPDVVVAPHSKRRVEVEVPMAGELMFSCRFHEAQGMRGAIYTRPDAPVLGAPGGVVSTTAPTPFPSGWGP
jgi:plastocyanin